LLFCQLLQQGVVLLLKLNILLKQCDLVRGIRRHRPCINCRLFNERIGGRADRRSIVDRG
jgi:hypothetical protein